MEPKIPGPDHPITITPATQRIQVRLGNVVIADSDAALSLKEASYPAVFYFPRRDLTMAAYTPTARHTHCPYKGEASYFTLSADGKTADNAAWSYETPFPAMAAIAGYVAFYPDKVSIGPAA